MICYALLAALALLGLGEARSAGNPSPKYHLPLTSRTISFRPKNWETDQQSSVALESGEKVHLDVYYESQCPGCHHFFITQLRPTANCLSEYINVNLVPYGNAQTVRQGGEVTFICQHGESECLLNKIHACSLARLGNNLQQVLLASCLFDFYDTPLSAGQKCTTKFGLKWKDVSECVNGAEGTTLEDKYGNETNSLNPPHRYVPYIAVDKYTGGDDYQTRLDKELKKVLCEALAKKGVTPSACTNEEEC